MWSCQSCDVKFSRESIEYHLYRNHVQPYAGHLKLFQCATCPFGTPEFDALAEHCLRRRGHEPAEWQQTVGDNINGGSTNQPTDQDTLRHRYMTGLLSSLELLTWETGYDDPTEADIAYGNAIQNVGQMPYMKTEQSSSNHVESEQFSVTNETVRIADSSVRNQTRKVVTAHNSEENSPFSDSGHNYQRNGRKPAENGGFQPDGQQIPPIELSDSIKNDHQIQWYNSDDLDPKALVNIFRGNQNADDLDDLSENKNRQHKDSFKIDGDDKNPLLLLPSETAPKLETTTKSPNKSTLRIDENDDGGNPSHIVFKSDDGGNKKGFPCTVCSRVSATRSQARLHRQTHSGTRSYVCDQCPGLAYAQQDTLRRHKLKEHEKAPPNYICDECGKTSYEAAKLANHYRVHSGQRPWPCSYCPKRFTHKQVLVHHTRVHTLERPFACTKCDRRFTQKTSLTQHLASFHPDLEAVAKEQAEFEARKQILLLQNNLSTPSPAAL